MVYQTGGEEEEEEEWCTRQEEERSGVPDRRSIKEDRGVVTWEVAFRNFGDIEEEGQRSQQVHAQNPGQEELGKGTKHEPSNH